MNTDRILDTVFFILFFLYFSIETLYPAKIASYENIALPVLFFLAVFLNCRRSRHPLLKRYAPVAGVACAILVPVLFQYVFPLIPSWETGTYAAVYMLLLSLTCLNRNYIKIIRAVAIALLLNEGTTLLRALGGLQNILVYQERGIIRGDLGTGHPNGISRSMLLLIVALYLGYLVRSVWGNLALVAAVYLFCDYYTRTRTGSLLCIILLIFQVSGYLLQRNQKLAERLSPVLRVFDLIAVASYPLNCLLWFGLIAAYPKGYAITTAVNGAMAGRIGIASSKIQEFGVSALGLFFQKQWVQLDNGYASLLIHDGVISVILLGVLWVWASVRFMRAGKRRLLYAFAFLALWGGEGTVLLKIPPNIFFALAVSDLSVEAPAETKEENRLSRIAPAAAVALFVAVLVLSAPVWSTRMRTINQIASASGISFHRNYRTWLSLLTLLLVPSALFLWIREYTARHTISKKWTAVLCGCAVVILAGFLQGNRVIRNAPDDIQALIDADAPAIETVLSSKTGALYADPFPDLYRKRFPEISRSFMYGKDLARLKNATVLTGIDVNGGLSFATQGFFYAPVSDAHAVYTNDESVIAALRDAGYTATPYFNQRQTVDLETSAANSYLTYDPELGGIFLDQLSEYKSEYPWSNFNSLYGGDYEATFRCRLLMPQDTDPDSSCLVAVNYSLGNEIASTTLTPADADKNGIIEIRLPFTVPYTKLGTSISFSVYGGDIRRLVVEEITYIQVG